VAFIYFLESTWMHSFPNVQRRNFLEALEAAFDQSNEMLAAENALENDFNE